VPFKVFQDFALVLNRLERQMDTMIQSGPDRKSCDTLVIGGGVLGLWAARHAIKRGERVIVLEKRSVGAGASGGFLGALMPHMPDNWNDKKQFQYDGLASLANAIASLESDTGHDCGYRRCGRIMPLLHEKVFPQVDRRLAGAKANWSDAHQMRHLSPNDKTFNDWLDPQVAPHGIQHDTLSARVNPRAYLAALAAYVRNRAKVLEGAEVVSLQIANNERKALLANGETFLSDRIIVANGWEAYPLLQPFMGSLNSGKSIGRGVKGQAVLLEYQHNDELPIMYHDGSYVVPHAGNRIAIGSTSLNEWSGAPEAFDSSDMGFYQNALTLVPALKDAPIIERWAGVRPRNTIDGRGTAPWLGPVPGHEGLIALIGGFKITLGVAHFCACEYT
jgi:glycine/D-amino acid oxidase-like deaminating enzyme